MNLNEEFGLNKEELYQRFKKYILSRLENPEKSRKQAFEETFPEVKNIGIGKNKIGNILYFYTIVAMDYLAIDVLKKGEEK